MKTLLEKIIEQGYEADLAQKIIRAGKVRVNNECVFIPSSMIREKDEIKIINSKVWVSRGALKLLSVLEQFNLDFEDQIVLDIGTSTGGFTQVALHFGAKHVYALDVGTNQIDYNLRINPKITVWEKTNLKKIEENMFDHLPKIILVDVSFISLKHVFEVLKNFSYSFQLLVLIKPQFEAKSTEIEAGGFVPNSLHPQIISKIKEMAKVRKFKYKKVVKSNVVGKKKKNQEYFALFERK